MKPRLTAPIILAALLLLGPFAAQGASAPLTFTALTGTTSQATGVFQAELSGLGLTELLSISMVDDSDAFGSPGVWSGFDLDGIKLSATNCADATCADGLVGLNVFDFVSGVLFTPGTMDASGPPFAGPCLAGTSGGGCDFDNSIATLGDFDGVFTGDPAVGSTGWLSLGRDGLIGFNLTAAVSLIDTLYLYIGEVGNNGELLNGRVEISDISIPPIPVPAAVWLFGSALLGFVGISRRRNLA